MRSRIMPSAVGRSSPWLLVLLTGAAAFPALGDESSPAAPPSIEQEFVVRLPDEVRPVPEPLAEGRRGFPIRGIKGWLWLPEQYLAEIPVLAQFKMNFLMICYGSMCDVEHFAWGSPQCNRWWEPLPEEKRTAYEKVARSCQEHGIQLCLSMNPNLNAARILDYGSEKDLDALWQHYAWMQGLGVKWFSVCLDDISRGIDAAGQAKAVNALFLRLRKNDPSAQFIFCPTFYWGAADNADARAYLEILARDLHPDIYVFWTGDAVITPKITREAAEAYKACVRHRLFLWDNYPVNDGNPTLHLGPVTGRAPDLCEAIDGYMSNSMHDENEINRIPLITCADYAYNPSQYDPARSIGQAILHLGETQEQRETLRDLVELYPGMLVYGKGTNWNPVVERLNDVMRTPHNSSIARAYVRYVEDVANRMAQAFPDSFRDAQDLLRENLAKLRDSYAKKYGGSSGVGP